METKTKNTKKFIGIILLTVLLTLLYFGTAIVSYNMGKKAGKQSLEVSGTTRKLSDEEVGTDTVERSKMLSDGQSGLLSDGQIDRLSERQSGLLSGGQAGMWPAKRSGLLSDGGNKATNDDDSGNSSGEANNDDSRNTSGEANGMGSVTANTTVPLESDTRGGSTPVAAHGKLSVLGIDLVDENNQRFQLKGVSTHGIQWFPEYINYNAFQTLRDDWQANVIRLAMYTGEGGYMTGSDQAQLESRIDEGVNYCTQLGMYCIIDWHILSDGNPNRYKEGAKVFFGKMSEKYKDHTNVLYEICNEPNGGVSWEEVKAYADEMIAVIRANDADAIIIVGTPTWSQDVDQVAANPVANPHNVMYAMHFYAATHKDALRNKVLTARNNQTPIIISEFSICEASGDGSIDYVSAEQWWSLIDSNHLSYVGWNLSNKQELSALIASYCTKTFGWSVEELSETGKWLRGKMRGER